MGIVQYPLYVRYQLQAMFYRTPLELKVTYCRAHMVRWLERVLCALQHWDPPIGSNEKLYMRVYLYTPRRGRGHTGPSFSGNSTYYCTEVCRRSRTKTTCRSFRQRLPTIPLQDSLLRRQCRTIQDVCTIVAHSLALIRGQSVR